MVFTAEDKILIKNLALLKHYGSRRLIKEFPNKGWKKMASNSCCVRFEQRLVTVWSQLKQGVIDKAIEQWRPRLRACIRAKGEHFEQLLN